jgi:hypothetical protein
MYLANVRRRNRSQVWIAVNERHLVDRSGSGDKGVNGRK